jgi:hypothetical protein
MQLDGMYRSNIHYPQKNPLLKGLRVSVQGFVGKIVSSVLLHLLFEVRVGEMALLSLRIAASVAKHLPSATPQV